VLNVSDAPAGWYPDPTPPTVVPGLRYWDGQAWTGHLAPAAPSYAVQVGPTTPDGVPLAGWGWRLLAYLIDTLLLAVVTVPLTIPQQVSFNREMQEIVEQSAGTDTSAFWSSYFDMMRSMMVDQLPVLLITIVYVVVMLRWKGATVGKLVLGLRIRLRETDELTWKAIIVRVLAFHGVAVLPFVFLAVGWWQLAIAVWLPVVAYQLVDPFWPLWDKKCQALHDKIAGTNVVKIR
jgi:uncharacterized RDD family membrane protein YckC